MIRWLMLLCWLAGHGAALADETILATHPVIPGRRGVPGSYWRVFTVARTPLVRTKAGGELKALTDVPASVWKVSTPLPPEGWAGPGFDDRTWPRARSFRSSIGWDPHLLTGSSGGFVSRPRSALLCSPTLALLCARGRFVVSDPAAVKGLRLSVSYRGGVVVYVNGTELLRGHLPQGETSPETLAEAYPAEAYYHPRQRDKSAGDGPPDPKLRIRKLEAAIPASMLRKGPNVLALEIHRAPYFGTGLTRYARGSFTRFWATCGLVEVKLTAQAGVASNTGRPDGIQVWTCATAERMTSTSYGDPGEPRGPVEILGVRNGTFCGQVVVSAPQTLKGVRAELTPLAHDEPNVPPVRKDDLELCYIGRGDWLTTERRFSRMTSPWDTLAPEPPSTIGRSKTWRGTVVGGAVQPIWIRVRIPRDAHPGTYNGKLTLHAEGLGPTVIPVNLTVIDWALPQPREFVTHLGVMQSPDSVAMWYKVPPWSEKHWALMEQSFKLLGELGNKTVYLPLIARTNLGNDQSMVRWVKQADGSFKHDFTVIDRYLDLALRHLRPDVVCLYVFDHESGGSRQWRYKGVKFAGPGIPVTQLDPNTGKVSLMYAPRLHTPEAKAFWKPVFTAVGERLRKRGLLASAMLGIANDHSSPTKEIKALLAELMPGAPWVVQTHWGDYHWGKTPGYFTQVYIHAFSTAFSWRPETYRNKRRTHDRVAWRRTAKQDWFLRGFGMGGSDLSAMRTVPERAFLHNCNGWGRIGADFWPLGQPRASGKRPGGYAKNTSSIAARFLETDWFQLNLERGGPEALFAPGPEGALPTVRFEVLRQGIQEAEARIFVERALVDPALRERLGEDLAKHCDALLERRVWALKSTCHMDPLREELFSCAADVASALVGR